MLEHRARLEKAHRTPASRPNTWWPSSASKPSTAASPASTACSTRSPRSPSTIRRAPTSSAASWRSSSRCRARKPVDPLTALGSYAGAMGASQFMPSSYRRYAVDGSNDKQRDLFADWDDIIASVANYFKEHGWVADGPVLAEAVLQPDAPVIADPAISRSTKPSRASRPRAWTSTRRRRPRTRRCCWCPRRQQLGPVVPRRLQEFRSDHALQPQRALRHGGARPRADHRRPRRGGRRQAARGQDHASSPRSRRNAAR